MSGKWIRKQDGAPPIRTIVIRYNPSATENAELEQLLSQIPYGMANKTWIACLKAGTKAMLRKLEQESTQTPSPQQTKAGQPQKSLATPPLATTAPARSAPRGAVAPLPSDGKTIQTKVQTRDEPVAPAAPAAPAAGFSKAAQRMFDS